jgi:hypothetical protein
MPRKLIPEELLTEKQKRDRKYRENNKKYAEKYSKYYYLKKLLEDPEYNRKRWKKKKQKDLNEMIN